MKVEHERIMTRMAEHTHQHTHTHSDSLSLSLRKRIMHCVADGYEGHVDINGTLSSVQKNVALSVSGTKFCAVLDCRVPLGSHLATGLLLSVTDHW